MTAPPVAPRQPPLDATATRAERPVVMRHRAQYAALRAIIGGIGTLGFRRASDLGARLGLMGYRPFGIRKYVVERQIEAAFPEWDRARVKETASAAYESLGRTTIETAILPRYGKETILDLFNECPTWHVVEEAMAQKKGVILVTGHLGNWELSGSYIAARGVDLEVVARQQENPLFDGYLTRTRHRIGMKVIYDGDAVKRVPRALRNGAMVGFVMDQGAVGLASTWVPFFKRLAKTPRGAATFALRLGSPIIFLAGLRQADGRFTATFEHVPVHLSGDKNADVDKIVADYTAVLERWVRNCPQQYFWHHRRWKHQQPGTPPELGNPL
jgi:Kdo2-lipid IVA lauroyltransferase/acyltransferase